MPAVEVISSIVYEALQPERPPLDIPYRGDDAGIGQVGLYGPEITLAMQLDCESFIRLYPPVDFRELDFNTSVIDTLYRETRSPSYKSSVMIPAYFKVSPPKNLLKRFGVEDEHDAVAMLSLGWLQKYQPDLRVKTGDRIGYYDQSYTESSIRPHNLPNKDVVREPVAHVPNMQFEILNVYYGDYWGNSQRPLHLMCSLKNLRAPGKHDTNVNPR